MEELSELIPNDVWLRNLELADNTVVLAGQAPAAAPLLGILGDSATLTDASFTTSLVKAGSGELFQIGAQRRVGDLVANQEATAPATADAPPAQPPAAQQEPTGTLNTISAEEPAGAGESN
jgi:hypothetical protein